MLNFLSGLTVGSGLLSLWVLLKRPEYFDSSDPVDMMGLIDAIEWADRTYGRGNYLRAKTRDGWKTFPTSKSR